MIKIKFKETEFILIGNKEMGGAITTQELYENFEPSFAHLYPNGEILSFGILIGNVKEIEWLDD